MHYCQSSRCLLPFVTQEKHFDVDNTSTTLRNYECRISTRKSVYRVQALRLLSSQVHKPAPSQIWCNPHCNHPLSHISTQAHACVEPFINDVYKTTLTN